MAENESGQEKTEQPTPKKLQQLMESGQFARSREVNTLVLMIGAMLVLTIMAPKMVDTFRSFMTSVYQQLGTLNMTPESFIGHFGHFMLTAGTLILPVMIMAMFAALLSSGAQSGMRVSPKAIEPKISKLSPLSGFKRMFSSQSFAKLAVSLLKFMVIFGFSYPVIKEVLNDPIFYTSTDIQHLLAFMGETIQGVALRVIAGMVVIAAADYAYQHWKNEQDSMMTKQEVKDESKQAEGNMQQKGEMRRRRRQMLMDTLNQEVPKADVIVTNPTHLAIALKYERGQMSAPRVVAKGARYNALRIREIAKKHDVPIVENKPVARLLFKNCKVGQEIIPDLFAAVAEILAYVYRTNRYKYYMKGHRVTA
jgi:flagellar biosynthetic protein FlhB|tara:strand:- start:654 stop:1751 length:1098 start_codon:yes stop_codon:yes gene_type:complete